MSENAKDVLAFQWHELSYLPKYNLVNDPNITENIYLQAPEAPKTPIKAILQRIFKVKF